MSDSSVTILIPFYNERESLPKLLQDLSAVAIKDKREYEAVLVDDGSTELLGKLPKTSFRQKVVTLARNSGKTAALRAGIANSEGEIIVMMDADLQDDPKDLPKFLKKIEEGFDLVAGNRTNRYGDNPIKLASSKVANLVVRLLTGCDVHDMNCGYKAMRRYVADNLDLHSDYHRFIPLLAHIKGYRVGEVKIKQHKRRFGQSKYGKTGVMRGFKFINDVITITFTHSYGDRPFALFGRIGILSFFLGVLALTYLTVIWFMGESIGNRPLLLGGALLVLFGVNFISLGLVGELITRQHKQALPPIKNIEIIR